jgi:hypothetical protein
MEVLMDQPKNPNEEAMRQLVGMVRPVVFENDSEEWKYSTNGSAVVLRCCGQLFVVTADHVLTNQGVEPRQVLIPYRTGSHLFLPFKSHHVLSRPIKAEDDLHADLSIFKVDAEKIESPGIDEEMFFDIGCNGHQARMPNTRYFMAGHPSETNGVDYERNVLEHQAAVAPLDLDTEEAFVSVDKFTVRNAAELASFAGFSGCGVFSITPDGTGRGIVRFEGIVVHGSRESMTCFAIRADFISKFLQAIQA